MTGWGGKGKRVLGGGIRIVPCKCGEQCEISVVFPDCAIVVMDIKSGARLPGSGSRLTHVCLICVTLDNLLNPGHLLQKNNSSSYFTGCCEN